MTFVRVLFVFYLQILTEHSSLVIDQLRDDHVDQKVAIAFVYFDYRDQRSQSPENVVASLLRQVASHMSVLPTSLIELYTTFKKQNRKPQIRDLELTLQLVCQNFDQVFIAIDALDECDEARRKHFLLFLVTLQETPKIRLFVTSRPYPDDIRKVLDPAPQITVQASDGDLRKYLRRKIEDSSNADIIDEDFREYLIETVVKGAQNMYADHFLEIIVFIVGQRLTSSRFLLPALQIQSIINEPTTGEMEDAIEAKPDDLHQAFYQTLARIQRQPHGRKRLGMNVLLWISHAQGSLTVEELSEALAVQPGNGSLNPRRRPSQNMMIECCLGLATVDQESSNIRLVHYALQEFFWDQREEIFPSGEDKIAEICIAYLFFDNFLGGCCEAEADIERLIDDFPLLRYASSYWDHHVRSSHSDRIYGLALKVLHSPPRRALSIQIQRFSHGYRSEYWEPDEVNSHSAFQCACGFGLQTAVCHILDSEDIDIDAPTHMGTTPLIRAASSGHVELVSLLMKRGADPEKANWYGSALHCAAEAGQCGSIMLLLDSGMNVDLRDDFGSTPLHCAADQRQMLAICLLLDKGADPNARDHLGMMLIHDAAQIGDERLMRRLLQDERVDTSATTVKRKTALHYAALGGHANIVRMLLDVGIEVDARDVGGCTALSLAAWWGKGDVVRLLVEAGANVNAKNNDKTTARYLAAAAIYKRGMPSIRYGNISNNPAHRLRKSLNTETRG